MPRTALVTGANQGLGLALVHALADRLGSEDTVYLAARDPARATDALDSLGATTATVLPAQLDVTDPISIGELAERIKSEGGVDIVASNAAARITPDRPQADQVRGFVATNNHGSKELYDALRPLLRRNARYAFVASSFGQLRNLPPELQPLFDTDTMTLDDIESSMDRYVAALEAGTAGGDGWPEWINIPSKIGQVATARIAARDMATARPDGGILINAVCPGLIDTEASRPWFDDMSHARQPAEAAAPIVDLLLTPPGATEPTGQLIQYGIALPWL